MLRIAIPKGSLEARTFELFQKANLPIRRRNDRDYRLTIEDPRITEAFMLRPQEIADYVSCGEFDVGILGIDWVVEAEAAVVQVADLVYSRGGWNTVKIVLATHTDNPVQDVRDIEVRSRVVTEYPRMTRKYFDQLGKRTMNITLSYGATEIKVPRLAEYLVDVMETGRTLEENGKKILDTILVSSTVLVANPESWDDPERKHAIEQIAELLTGVIRARDKVLIKMNVPGHDLPAVTNYLPAERSPTVSLLFSREKSPEKWYAVESVVQRSRLNVIISDLKRLGACDILELEVGKVIP